MTEDDERASVVRRVKDSTEDGDNEIFKGRARAEAAGTTEAERLSREDLYANEVVRRVVEPFEKGFEFYDRRIRGRPIDPFTGKPMSRKRITELMLKQSQLPQFAQTIWTVTQPTGIRTKLPFRPEFVVKQVPRSQQFPTVDLYYKKLKRANVLPKYRGSGLFTQLYRIQSPLVVAERKAKQPNKSKTYRLVEES